MKLSSYFHCCVDNQSSPQAAALRSPSSEPAVNNFLLYLGLINFIRTIDQGTQDLHQNGLKSKCQ